MPTSLIKRRRQPHEVDDDVIEDKPIQKPAPPPALVVTGLGTGCSVLDLKSRFEIYGSTSRIRIDRDGVAYVMYRTKDSAEAAIAASLDPSFGDNLDSEKVNSLSLSLSLALSIMAFVCLVAEKVWELEEKF